VAELAVTVGVVNGFPSSVSLNRVADETKVTGGDHDHGFHIGDNLLVFLKGVHLGTNDDPSASLVVVQNMDILEGKDTEDGG
jgi:hypothetical protein